MHISVVIDAGRVGAAVPPKDVTSLVQRLRGCVVVGYGHSSADSWPCGTQQVMVTDTASRGG